MAKAKTIYTCTECGGQSPKWQGQCPHCEAWNTLVETVAEVAPSGKNRFARWRRRGKVQTPGRGGARRKCRALPTGIAEFDRVLGGGLVRGRGGADRRRSRHRQIHAAAAGAGASVQARRTCCMSAARNRRSRSRCARRRLALDARRSAAAARDPAGKDPGRHRRRRSRRWR